MDHSRVVVFVIIIFASLVISPTGVAADTAHEISAPVGQTSSTTVPITQQLQLNPETTGSIHVTTSVDVTLKLKQFGLYINDSAQRVTVDGFSRTNTEDSIAGYDRYEWDGNTRTPSISYNLNVNTTNDNGKYKTVDAGEWAIVEVPSVPYSWRASEEIEIVNDHEIDGSGVIKRGFAFLGDHAIRTATAHDQQFRLVIPDAANLTESPEAILDNVAYASKQLQVGERDSDVVMIAAPTSEISNGLEVAQPAMLSFGRKILPDLTPRIISGCTNISTHDRDLTGQMISNGSLKALRNITPPCLLYSRNRSDLKSSEPISR